MKSFTQLVGSTTAGANPGSFADLSQNNSTENVALGAVLCNDQHRYLIQKYFDNEGVYTLLTIGAQTIVVSATPAVGDTTATLTVAWPYSTATQLVVFGDGEQRSVTFTQGSTNIFWQTPLYGVQFATTVNIAAGATTATLSTAWTGTSGALTAFFSDGSSKSITFTANSTAISWTGGITGTVENYVRTFQPNTTITTIGVGAYPIPANVSKIKNDTITIGQLVYTPAPVMSIQEWTMLTALPYTSDIPAYFYIYQQQLLFWPIPSSSGNLITLNIKRRVPNLTYADYATGTITGSVNNNAITGSATSWNATGNFPLNTDLTFANLYLKATPPKGDGLWYPIQRFTTDSALLLNLPIVNAPSLSGASYIIGQLPLLSEDFQDAIVYGALLIYFSTIKKDKEQYTFFKGEYDKRIQLLEDYAGTKSVNVDLGSQPIPANPNLFIFAPPN